MNDHLPNESQLRFASRACVVGLLTAYALVYPLKWVGLMPDHLSWIGLTLGPAAIFSMFGSAFVGLLRLKQRWWMLFFPISLVAIAVLLGLNVANWK